MKRLLTFSLIALALLACGKNSEDEPSSGENNQEEVVVYDTSIEGDLYCKNTVKAVFKTAPDVNYTCNWYYSSFSGNDWIHLQGINTTEIVLLTNYADRYLKCVVTAEKDGHTYSPVEIISATPIEDRGNPNVEWFHEARLGLMVHFLKNHYVPLEVGGYVEWNAVVDGFDAENFARQCHEAGVGYVMWALGQNDGFYNSPNAAYDEICNVSAGRLCSLRDLPADIIKALKQYGIKFMFYLPGNPPYNNPIATPAFGYTLLKDTPTSQDTQEKLERVIREWSLRYGKDLCGWWFDGMYNNGIMQTRSDMSLKYNISTHTLAAKAGNPQSIVTYSNGVEIPIRSNSPYNDYAGGEQNGTIDELCVERWVDPGVQWFHFTYLGYYWLAPGIKYDKQKLLEWARNNFQNGGVLCFDVYCSKEGNLDAEQVAMLKELSQL